MLHALHKHGLHLQHIELVLATHKLVRPDMDALVGVHRVVRGHLHLCPVFELDSDKVRRVVLSRLDFDHLDVLQAAGQVVDAQDVLSGLDRVDAGAGTLALNTHDGVAREAVALAAGAFAAIRRIRMRRALHHRGRAGDGLRATHLGLVRLVDRLRDAAGARAAIKCRNLWLWLHLRGARDVAGEVRGVLGLESDTGTNLQANEELLAGSFALGHRNATKRHLNAATGPDACDFAEGGVNPARGLGLRRVCKEGCQTRALLVAMSEVRQPLTHEAEVLGACLQDRVQLRRR
mmetsp:Transcript_115582/g.331816  ORF Transcript_115582/g.331816 Transcript_115582/m.331816 type:complete len:291 (-) Transcript_115582:880-1752(-)